jgi:hypothetical protein
MADQKAMKIAKLLQADLGPNLENMYKSWALENRVPQSNDYDMRGYFYGNMMGKEPQAEMNPADMQLHFTDTYKFPNHPSFSNESMFDLQGNAPRWVQPAPYTEGTWAQQGRKGLLNLELPFGKGK